MATDIQILRNAILRDASKMGYLDLRFLDPALLAEAFNRQGFPLNPDWREQGSKLAKIMKSRKIRSFDLTGELTKYKQLSTKLKNAVKKNPEVAAFVSALDGGGIDIGDPDVQQKVRGFASAAGLTGAEVTALLNMALQTCSYAEYLGLGTVTTEQIIATGVMRQRWRE